MLDRARNNRLINKSTIYVAVIIMMLVLALSLNTKMTQGQPEEPNFRNVVLFATHSIDLKNSSIIKSGGSRNIGDVVVNISESLNYYYRFLLYFWSFYCPIQLVFKRKF